MDWLRKIIYPKADLVRENAELRQRIEDLKEEREALAERVYDLKCHIMHLKYGEEITTVEWSEKMEALDGPD